MTDESKVILAGDVGGTHTRLACFVLINGRPKQLAMEVYPSRQYGGVEEIVERFTDTYPQTFSAACFGIAGPIKNRICKTSNLPWVVNGDVLDGCLQLDQVGLLNDLEANAHGIAALEQDDFVLLNPGLSNPTGNRGLISAGTGLGEAALFWNGYRYQPLSSEGGHADFAPRNDLEIDLLVYLLESYQHVSYERVLSGPGLHNIYKFLVATGRGEEPAWLRENLEEQDPGAVISKAALEQHVPICEAALDLFVSIYGAEAGNLALKVLATGGMFIGGGIAPKMIEMLRRPPFVSAFWSKGRMTMLLKDMPIWVIVNDQAALLGAALVAFGQGEPTP